MSEDDIRDRLTRLIAVYDGLVKSQERRVREAVAAERERCAAVVAGFAYRGEFGTNTPDRFIESIIKAIREGR